MKKILIIIAVIGTTLSVQAQQHEVLTHYITNPYLYNTARVGQNKYIDVGMLYRKQWVNVPDAPDTKILTVQGMIKNKFGVGAKIYMDKAHIIENFGAKFSYAYYIRMKNNPDNHYLSIGVAAGFKMQNIRFDEATINHQDDPAIFYNGVRKTIFDADAGINYYMKGLNVGVGVSNLAPLSYNYESNTNSLNYKSIYHLYGNVSYDIMMGQNKDLALKPGVLVRYVPNIPIQFDGSLLFDYKNIFWVGGGYRYKNVGVFGMAGVRLFDMVSVGYAYEQSIDGNQGALGSTHEFNLGLLLSVFGYLFTVFGYLFSVFLPLPNPPQGEGIESAMVFILYLTSYVCFFCFLLYTPFIPLRQLAEGRVHVLHLTSYVLNLTSYI